MPRSVNESATQVTGRLTPDERKQFGGYAEALGLDAGTVATLLMTRELRIRRLDDLRSDARFRPSGITPRTITSHRFRKSEKQRFLDHIGLLGLSASKALGLLCRVELFEAWLEKALVGDSYRVRN